jgi:predicted NBD/HSP70 family sugar kinase
MAAGDGKGRMLRMALCIGGTTADVAALDGEDRIIEEESLRTHVGGALMEAGKSAQDRAVFTLEHWDEFTVHRLRLLDELGATVDGMARRLLRGGFRISGVGISAPGAIHPRTGEMTGALGALNLPAWGRFNLKKEIRDRTGLCTRAINDAKAMALGALARICRDVVRLIPTGDGDSLEEEFLGPEGRTVRDFIELDPGTGLGGAYIVDHGLWFGPDADAPDPDVGEIWKLQAVPDRPGINLEELTSGRATLDRVEAALRALAPEEGGALIERSGGRIQTMLEHASFPLRTVVEGDLKQTGRYLGLGIRFLMTRERERLGAPDIRTFMIGGGMVSGRSAAARHVRFLLHQAIAKELEDMVPLPRIFFSILGGRAGLFGSAALVRD